MKKVLVTILCLVMALSAVSFCTAEPDEGITIVDNEYVTVRIVGFENSSFSYDMNLFLENKTDKTVMFSLDNACVNGLSSDPLFAFEVAPGKKANTNASWYSLESDGITGDVTVISGSVRAYDSNDWMADAFAKETFTVYPLGEEAAVFETREPGENDILITDNDACTIIVTGFNQGVDFLYDFTLDLYLVNKTDSALMVSVDDVSVDGFMCDPFWAKELPADCGAYANIGWFESSLNESGITDLAAISELELKFKAYDSDDWMADPYYEEVSTITVK